MDELLNAREWRIALMLPSGKTNKEVADELCVAVKTVKWHITNIYRKWHCRNRVEFVMKMTKYMDTRR
jgi:NarL family two-component system response regulator LiaR